MGGATHGLWSGPGGKDEAARVRWAQVVDSATLCWTATWPIAPWWPHPVDSAARLRLDGAMRTVVRLLGTLFLLSGGLGGCSLVLDDPLPFNARAPVDAVVDAAPRIRDAVMLADAYRPRDRGVSTDARQPPPRDAAVPGDAAPPDTARPPPDGARPDPDSALPVPDAALPAPDAALAVPDAALPDAAVPDAAVPDALAPDAGL